MAKFLVSVVVLLCSVALATSSSCKSPTVTSTGFSTTDGTIVSQVAYIAEFTLKCADGQAVPLFAQVGGVVSPIATVGENKFQVSWTEDVKASSKGELKVRIFDEDSYAQLRKAQRSNEDLHKVKELATVSVKHPGVFKGPLINSEFLALFLSAGIAYLAIFTRSKIQA